MAHLPLTSNPPLDRREFVAMLRSPKTWPTWPYLVLEQHATDDLPSLLDYPVNIDMVVGIIFDVPTHVTFVDSKGKPVGKQEPRKHERDDHPLKRTIFIISPDSELPTKQEAVMYTMSSIWMIDLESKDAPEHKVYSSFGEMHDAGWRVKGSFMKMNPATPKMIADVTYELVLKVRNETRKNQWSPVAAAAIEALAAGATLSQQDAWHIAEPAVAPYRHPGTTSAYLRAGLPSLKRQLFVLRLWLAAALAEHGLNVNDVAYALNVDPSGWRRIIKHTFKMKPTEFATLGTETLWQVVSTTIQWDNPRWRTLLAMRVNPDDLNVHVLRHALRQVFGKSFTSLSRHHQRLLEVDLHDLATEVTDDADGPFLHNLDAYRFYARLLHDRVGGKGNLLGYAKVLAAGDRKFNRDVMGEWEPGSGDNPPVPNVGPGPCQCEHEKHFGHGGHPYGEVFDVLIPLRINYGGTDMGDWNVCKQCKAQCWDANPPKHSTCQNCGEPMPAKMNRYCGAYVCDVCGHHEGLARCYCGWTAGDVRGGGREELEDMGEVIDPDPEDDLYDNPAPRKFKLTELKRLQEKLTTLRTQDVYSPQMFALLGFLVGKKWTTPYITGLHIDTSSGYIQATTSANPYFAGFGSMRDAESNLRLLYSDGEVSAREITWITDKLRSFQR